MGNEKKINSEEVSFGNFYYVNTYVSNNNENNTTHRFKRIYCRTKSF